MALRTCILIDFLGGLEVEIIEIAPWGSGIYDRLLLLAQEPYKENNRC